MQEAALEAIPGSGDVVLISATGSGKTLAFLLPLLQLMDFEAGHTQAMIVVPSRELALQIESVFRMMKSGFKVTTCYGGHLRETEENNLIEAPALIIGTPGRICDHLRRQNIKTAGINTLILDEFDKSLELGFLEEMSFITETLTAVDKRVLTSATEAVEVPAFIGLTDVKRVDFSDENVEVEAGLAVEILRSEGKDKIDSLFHLLCYHGGRSSIIFCNHREAVERISNLLTDRGIYNEFYHGGMEQQERDSALCKFRNGTTNILVTTDLAARGLDIPNIRYIIHYHLPLTEDAFTHRNGRTARMEKSGTAILLLGPEEEPPSYLPVNSIEIEIPEGAPLPERPKWTTLFIAAGKKDKVNKIDIVGFLSHKGNLKKEDIGLIEVKDFFSFVAIRRAKAAATLQLIRDQKIKNKKVKIEVAK